MNLLGADNAAIEARLVADIREANQDLVSAEARLVSAVDRARIHGLSWEQLAERAFGVSRQATWERFRHRVSKRARATNRPEKAAQGVAESEVAS